ncbi:hypothetical protein IV203_003555 [Nitzschia inconspicua]|uniref:Uncharacterized protein n=1 Tax=Nitzschia inconspicua TaxID=303405 RepID=A0A9K3L229_9STRA|nr:hypothetical protein IV203_003555 [Nitzschia inconspicua]
MKKSFNTATIPIRRRLVERFRRIDDTAAMQTMKQCLPLQTKLDGKSSNHATRHCRAISFPHEEYSNATIATTTSSRLENCCGFRSFSTATRSDEDIEADLEDSFSLSIREYQNLWSDPPDKKSTSPYFLGTIQDDIRLDRQSRFILELLQTMYQVGLTKTVDRVTTDRCNAMIQRLMKSDSKLTHDYNLHQNDPSFIVWPEEYEVGAVATSASASKASNLDSENATQSFPLSYWHRCERARAILESMELFQPLQERHPGKLPVALPVPNHETYFQVLQMYSSKQMSGIDDDSLQQQAPLLAHAIVTRMENTQKLALQPLPRHWNHVLSAYANSNRPKRPLEAATLLYELNTKTMTDESSFSHVLRCCIDTPHNAKKQAPRYTTHRSKYVQQQREKFAQISLAVAQRVWKGLTQQHEQSQTKTTRQTDHLTDLLEDRGPKKDGIIQFQSYHFVHMLRVARNFSDFSAADADSINQKQAEWVQRYFSECAHHQKVNLHVLLEVIYQAKEMAERNSSSEDDVDELDWIAKLLSSKQDGVSLEGSLAGLKGKRKQADSRTPSRIAKALLRSCPPSWTAKAD